MKKELSPKQREELLAALKSCFEKSLNRHKGLDWVKVQAQLEAKPDKLWSLAEMERTGDEPVWSRRISPLHLFHETGFQGDGHAVHLAINLVIAVTESN